MREAAAGPDASAVDARTQVHLPLLRGLHLSVSDGHAELREAGVEREGAGQNITTAASSLFTQAHIYRYYLCLGSIAMTAVFHASPFCASFGSNWCSFIWLRSLGLPQGLFPPTFIVVACFATFLSSLLITWPYHEQRFWVTCEAIGLTIASLMNFSFLIRSFFVLPRIHLSIFNSVVCILCCSALSSVHLIIRVIHLGLCEVIQIQKNRDNFGSG